MSNQTVQADSELDLFEQRVTALAKAEEDSCPFCGWEVTIKGVKAESIKSLSQHLRTVHVLRIAKSINETDEEENIDPFDLLPKKGLEVTDSFDVYPILKVEDDIQKTLQPGEKFRWVAPRNVQRYKDMGATVEKYSGEAKNLNNSSEDGTVKSNEMILMRFPARLVAQREAFKKQMAGEILPARQEDMAKNRSKTAARMYDIARRKGMSKTQAKNLATVIENGMDADIEITRG